VQTIGKPIAAQPRSVQHIALSASAHALALLLIAAALHHSKAWIAPYRLPGTALGHNFVVAYMPDRAPEQSATAKAKTQPDPKLTAPKSLLPTPAKPKPEHTTAPSTATTASPNPDAATGADALGSGNITIALTAYFPPPHPDLSALPHGTRGDVILRVVIDTDGKITDLKKLSGLGYGVDETVIATVQQWTFHPALQNGHPVASEQELHFHYERG
jgi:periplasmic protein TonB